MLVGPVSPAHHCNTDDLLAIHEYRRELAAHWSPTYDALGLRAPAWLLFQLFPMEFLQLFFRGYPVDSQPSLLCDFLPEYPTSFDTHVTHNAFLELSSVTWPWQATRSSISRRLRWISSS
jgi:hypothetical protein